MRLGIKVGNFVPENYVRQVVENSDFRKYDDGLRMILDCTEELANALTERLAKAAASGIVRYGLHRQDAAMMTCFTPSVMRSDHVHFIDGARGGYASAATALKAMAAEIAAVTRRASAQTRSPRQAAEIEHALPRRAAGYRTRMAPSGRSGRVRSVCSQQIRR